MTSPNNPANNLKEFIKAMNGRTINLAIPGVGTGSDIEAEYFFKELAKVPVQPIPYQGGAPAINATVAGQVDLMATTLGGGAAAQIAGGKLKGLGIAADKRAAVSPNVPTYAEQGYPPFTAASWVGFFAPAKTDPQILQTLNAAINDIVKKSGRGKEAQRYGLRPNHRLTASGRRHVRGRGQEVGRHGHGARAVDQIDLLIRRRVLKLGSGHQRRITGSAAVHAVRAAP